MSAQQSLSFEDQNKINKFSKYLQRKTAIQNEIDKLEKDINLDSTASEELEVLIEDKVDF
jgi:chaperonin cofactor prefoldin